MTRREPPVDPPEPRCHDCGRRFADADTIVRDERDDTYHVECWRPA